MEARETRRSSRFPRVDWILCLALFAAFVFSVRGLRWGRVEDWNPDQMALRGLSLTLKPHEFLKPPFHTFLNHLLVLWPLSIAEFAAKLVTHRPQHFDEVKLIGSRLLHAVMYLGTIVLAWKIADWFYGRRAARVIAFLFATSAGFVYQTHFLTADIPVVFWMMLAAFFCARIILDPRMKNYFVAGLCTGLATATKYNGLAVGLAIPVAHVLSQEWSWRAFLPDRRLLLGLFMVLVGFVLGNPYSILDWPKFSSDFAYNYTVTPRYGGETGLGFGKFAQEICQILGWPGGILVYLLAILSALLLVRQKPPGRATKCVLLFASVFLLYALKIGAFPRVPMRFVLPAVPFLILMIGPALTFSQFPAKWIVAALAPIFLYNCICSFYVGKHFRDDPRSAAQVWMQTNVWPPSRIESSAASPHWSRLPRMNAVEINAAAPKWQNVRPQQIADLRMPRPNSRAELFSRVFAENKQVVEMAQRRERPPDETQFTLDKLAERRPDYVAVYSSDYVAPFASIRKYYDDLLNGRFPYRIVFDATAPTLPRWIYPQEMTYGHGRMTILKRID